MMINKTFAYLFVSLILTGAVTLSAIAYIKNSNDAQAELESERPLLAATLFQEALQELCPFPGFNGNFCPGPMAPRSNLIRAGPPLMPSGIGASFDITTGDLKLPSIQLTYSSGQVYTDPASNRQFMVADEINAQAQSPSADTRIFKDTNELASVWRDASERGEWLGGQYSSSKDLNDLFEKYFNGDQQTSVSQLTKSVVRLSFKSYDLKLNKYAQRAIDSLPINYAESVYTDFLNSWGTHISVDTNIGGMVEKQTVFKECVYSSPSYSGGLSQQQISQALTNELYGNQGDAYFAARRRVSIDRKLGGNPEDVWNWEQTISQNPALLKINRFVSWSDLASHPQVKANLQQAISNRIQAMKARVSASLAQVNERRRQQKIQLKPAYFVQRGSNNDFLIKQQFQLQTPNVCPVGSPFKKECLLVQITPPPQQIPLFVLLGYERDDQGRFRTNFVFQHQPFYGQWVESGCSIAQSSQLAQYTDLNQALPNGSSPQLICSGCTPENVNGGRLACMCPGF